MNFHLNYTPEASRLKISHKDKIMLIGSCFAEEIGGKLKANKFDCLINPNGILFNPASIAAAIHSYKKPDKYQLKFGENNGLHFSYDHHGSFSSSSKAELEQEIKKSISEAHSFLKEAKILIITLGSAFIYRRMEDASIVANCHKLPQNQFMKGFLNSNDVSGILQHLLNELRDFNPELSIIYTISPVKYLRDGLEGNTLSKAMLIEAVHHAVNSTSNPQSTLENYFPAYELVTDDLRDYRFYKEDMAHPNEQAINYVWEKFAGCYFNEETKKLNQKIKEVALAVNHRPLKSDSTQYSEFKNTIIKKCTELENSYPFLNFSEEKEQLINQ
jgi:hypothetical protein